MKKQIVILEVKFDEEEDKNPNFWDWNSLIGCKECIKLLNHGAAEEDEK